MQSGVVFELQGGRERMTIWSSCANGYTETVENDATAAPLLTASIKMVQALSSSLVLRRMSVSRLGRESMQSASGLAACVVVRRANCRYRYVCVNKYIRESITKSDARELTRALTLSLTT